MMQELERGYSGVVVQPATRQPECFRFISMAAKNSAINFTKNASSMAWMFWLTEPNHGSDPGVCLQHKDNGAGHVLLNGASWIAMHLLRRWRGMGKDDAGDIRGVM